MLERVQAAHIEQITSEIESVDVRQAEEVRQLGERLYFNRCGPAALFGCEPPRRNKLQTSFSGESTDPDHPAKIVAELVQNAAGCRWLIEQWTILGEQLEGTSFWQTIDRFRAIRLLGCQPIDAGHDRVIAEIFVASYAIEPRRKKPDDGFGEDPEPTANLAFQDVKSDFSAHELTQFAAGAQSTLAGHGEHERRRPMSRDPGGPRRSEHRVADRDARRA